MGARQAEGPPNIWGTNQKLLSWISSFHHTPSIISALNTKWENPHMNSSVLGLGKAYFFHVAIDAGTEDARFVCIVVQWLSIMQMCCLYGVENGLGFEPDRQRFEGACHRGHRQVPRLHWHGSRLQPPRAIWVGLLTILMWCARKPLCLVFHINLMIGRLTCPIRNHFNLDRTC